jgi:hypothetical protein
MGGIIQVDSVLNNNTSNLITQTNSTTITIGSTGQTISLASGASSSGFGLAWNPTVQTTNFTASVNVGYMVNTSSAAITVTLPAAPSISDQIAIVDFQETAATNNITLNPNGLKIDGVTSNALINKGGEGVTILYSGTTRGWIPVSAANEGTAALLSQFSLDFLVVAGGGSGGAGRGGGGGAGGYRTSTQNAIQGTIITVTVGDGGALVSGGLGNNGSNSSISGSGLTTITSAGGGGGGADGPERPGVNGGSGGGGVQNNGGSGNTPSTSPSQGNNGGSGAGAPNYGAGGGGGAGAVGGNGASTVGGNGGAGTASSITGSSVTRAGGGGGGTYDGGTPGNGGTGGGGAGGRGGGPATSGTAGTANTGGGGGGGGQPGITNSGAGGKGVVIISVATIHYSATSSGSPTVTTSGSNTILQFNGSGTYTV